MLRDEPRLREERVEREPEREDAPRQLERRRDARVQLADLADLVRARSGDEPLAEWRGWSQEPPGASQRAATPRASRRPATTAFAS